MQLTHLMQISALSQHVGGSLKQTTQLVASVGGFCRGMFTLSYITAVLPLRPEGTLSLKAETFATQITPKGLPSPQLLVNREPMHESA